MLRLDHLRSVERHTDPFPYVLDTEFVSAEDCVKVRADFPDIQVIGARSLGESSYGQAFDELAQELNGPEFEATCEDIFGVSLNSCLKVTSVRGVTDETEGKIHTDILAKVVTVLLYMNERWDGSPGSLRLLRSPVLDDVLVEVPPLQGTLVAFRRTDNSWHGYEKFTGPRKVIQLNWYDKAYADGRLAELKM